MPTALPDFSKLKPAGGKRSSKREQIVGVFLRQEGHLSADDLVDLMRQEDRRISRATVYRTLQWMVDAGIARKVDFGEGRFRFAVELTTWPGRSRTVLAVAQGHGPPVVWKPV